MCIAQSRLTLSMAYSPPGSSVHGIFQVRILGLPFPPPRDLPDSGIESESPASFVLAGRVFPHWEAQILRITYLNVLLLGLNKAIYETIKDCSIEVSNYYNDKLSVK